MNAQIEYGVFLSPESIVGGLSAANGPASTRAAAAASVRGEVEAWALHAARSSGFGAAEAVMDREYGASGAPKTEASTGSTANRQRALGEWLKSVRQEWAQRWSAYQTGLRWRRQTRALEGLDARLLKDIGVDMSEAGSVAAEIVGTAVRTRRRIPCSG